LNLGFVISMYDEIDIVKQTISNLKKFGCKIIVIQSDPGNKEMILDGSICDKYENMSDLAGSRKKYAEIVKKAKKGQSEMIGPIALTRNFNKGHLLIQEFDIDYVIAITGDVKITNLIGITKIINKMNKQNKKIGGTRTIGYTMFDEFGKFTQFQHKDISNIMPQFFISNIKSIREGLFCNTERTNKYTTEQCFGDEIVRYAKENNMSFFDVFYRICDYGYPRFINGLYYNPEQISRIPPPFEGLINWIRYHSSQKINDWITKQFLKMEKSKE
jgi:hypothetical protein